MCGITGYVGKRNAAEIGLKLLEKLVYRGYDSAGFASLDGANFSVMKAVGHMDRLYDKLNGSKPKGGAAICHTRWATHGIPTERNAHPHSDCAGRYYVVHNGVIENYKTLKRALEASGHVFASETDTEVLAHLFEETRKTTPSLFEAVRLGLQQVQGTFGLVLISSETPETLYVAARSSPILLGKGDGEYFIASDPRALILYTRDVEELGDDQIAVVTAKGHRVYDLDGVARSLKAQRIEWSEDEAEKGGYRHFMEKEIFSGPEAVANSIRGRLLIKEGNARLGGLNVDGVLERLSSAKRIYLSGCGTSYYAALFGQYLLKQAGIPAEAGIASEFRYSPPIFDPDDVVVLMSQSGETADTIGFLREAKKKVLTLGIVNVVGSKIARDTDAGIYQHISPEVGVASTKAFISQITILSLFTLLLARQRGMPVENGQMIAQSIARVPDLMQSMLSDEGWIKHIADLSQKYVNYTNFLYLGRGINYPTALEGALKLKEVSYIHAEGYPAGEMKHGPIAMIDENFVSVFIVPENGHRQRVFSNMEEIRARYGPVLAVATAGDLEVNEHADDIITIPPIEDTLSPILATVPLQLFAYKVGTAKGINVDMPRNLAKSVTVE
ncbi:glutamine--fructose-6-phosphate transaminase (isomerizing) [Candidatus Giovannonibacteria bacterium]|nr:glutamine--fructose-6-phosphate transaminase (isomerizing) [Candidatus Giovannonibacteria bacterium]